MFNQKNKTILNNHIITATPANHHRSAFLTKSNTHSGWFSVAVLFLITLFLVGKSMNAVADGTGSFVENEFIMNDRAGNMFSRQSDVEFSWDGSLYTDSTTQTAANMSIVSNTPFFSFPIVFHDVRGFGPGNYSFTTANGSELTMEVSEGQIGAHLLYDWNTSKDINMVVVWDIEKSSENAHGSRNNFCKNGNALKLVTADGNGDGTSGIPMVEAPLAGFSPVFNVTVFPFSAAEWLVLCGH